MFHLNSLSTRSFSKLSANFWIHIQFACAQSFAVYGNPWLSIFINVIWYRERIKIVIIPRLLVRSAYGETQHWPHFQHYRFRHWIFLYINASKRSSLWYAHNTPTADNGISVLRVPGGRRKYCYYERIYFSGRSVSSMFNVRSSHTELKMCTRYQKANACMCAGSHEPDIMHDTTTTPI